jgi:hypothetical protein
MFTGLKLCTQKENSVYNEIALPAALLWQAKSGGVTRMNEAKASFRQFLS